MCRRAIVRKEKVFDRIRHDARNGSREKKYGNDACDE
jgi:hypothetical protein